MAYSLRGRYGLDCTRLHQFPSLRHLSPAVTVMCPRRAVFPLRFPLLVRHHTKKGIQGPQQPVHLYCTPSTVFTVKSFLFRCYKASVSDAIPPCVMASLRAKQGGGFAFSLMPYFGQTAVSSSLKQDLSALPGN